MRSTRPHDIHSQITIARRTASRKLVGGIGPLDCLAVKNLRHLIGDISTHPDNGTGLASGTAKRGQGGPAVSCRDKSGHPVFFGEQVIHSCGVVFPVLILTRATPTGVHQVRTILRTGGDPSHFAEAGGASSKPGIPDLNGENFCSGRNTITMRLFRKVSRSNRRNMAAMRSTHGDNRKKIPLLINLHRKGGCFLLTEPAILPCNPEGPQILFIAKVPIFIRINQDMEFPAIRPDHTVVNRPWIGRGKLVFK